MYNIPSNDPGLVLVEGDLQTFCEWLVRRAGGIATCVESAEMMVEHVVKGLPISAAQDNWLADDLLARGQASPNGATNYVAASAQMTRLGVPNDPYGADWFATHDFVSVVQDSIRRGMPVLFGFSDALLAHDDWTNQPEDGGVHGHGITIFGFDSTGAIVGDPNTAQAERGDFVHYTWANLKAAGGSSISMVVCRGNRQGGSYMATDLDGAFTISADTLTYTLKSNPAIVLSGGELALFKQLQGATGLPRGTVVYSESLRTKYADSQLCFRLFERAVVVYDPAHKKDSQPGFGDFFLGHIDDPDYGIASVPAAPSDDEAAEASAKAQEDAALKSAQNALAAAQAKIDAAKAALA